MARAADAVRRRRHYRGDNGTDATTRRTPMSTAMLMPETTEQIAERALGYLSGAAVAGTVYLGDQLGLYRAMRGAGPLSSEAVAERAGLHERWVREWLHGQASAGLVIATGDGRFELTAEQAAVLAGDEDPSSAVGGFAVLMPLLQNWERLHAAFRTGQGTAYHDLGHAHAVGEARFSGPWMRANLVPVIIPGLAGLAAKLTAGAKAADVGCGSGGALLELARAFPKSEFHGYDSAGVAIDLAQERFARAGVANVTLHHAPAAMLPADASFDFIMTWDCLHDMTRPDVAMRAIRAAIRPDGTWLIVDINGAPAPGQNYDNPLAPLLYGFSVLDCLGCSTSEEGGLALGTLGLPEPVARSMTADAGFTRFAVHDFGNPLNAFYEVRP
jgi:2-polyprenyl-3-methyl-5-hydroxy-6-metoxy-1,4-benzoquinol methylase